MNRQYGIPYMGSKSKIADKIINFLPRGNRFVDLFGGGFAITHCAMCHNKWKNFLYNDINPLVTDLVKRAIKGEFNYKKFKPEFITREEFNEKKDIDGYIKYIWSFGNSGQNYLFGKEIEEIKKAGHNAVIFDDFTLLKKYLPEFQFTSKDIKKRRLELKASAHKRVYELEQLEQLEQLERLQQLEQLERLEISNISYLDYQYKEGDVVYCDIPYQNAAEYDSGFNHEEFYEWFKTREYPVYFSSYPLGNFQPCYEIEKLQTLSATNNSKKQIECIYCNKETKKSLLDTQLQLFTINKIDKNI